MGLFRLLVFAAAAAAVGGGHDSCCESLFGRNVLSFFGSFARPFLLLLPLALPAGTRSFGWIEWKLFLSDVEIAAAAAVVAAAA